MILVKCIVFIADDKQGGNIISKESLDLKPFLLNPIILEDFDWSGGAIGKAVGLEWEGNTLIATMEIPGKGLDNFPAIGYHIENGFNELLSISLCKKPNVDSRIKSIGEQIL